MALSNLVSNRPVFQGFSWGQCAKQAAIGAVTGAAIGAVTGVAAQVAKYGFGAVFGNVAKAAPKAKSSGAGGFTSLLGNLLKGGVKKVTNVVGNPFTKALAQVPKQAPNKGALGPWWNTTLKAGTIIDRYGLDTGKYAAPTWVPKLMRALPPATRNLTKTTYVVTENIRVKMSITMPWYGQLGLGPQYRFSEPIGNLINHGLKILG